MHRLAATSDPFPSITHGVFHAQADISDRRVAPVEEFPEQKWDAIVAINLPSAFHLIKAVVPGMKSRRFGRIINIASPHGLTASPFKISEADVARDVLLVHQPRKEFVRIDALAALAVFHSSDAAASMTASALAMDGGWTQH